MNRWMAGAVVLVATAGCASSPGSSERDVAPRVPVSAEREAPRPSPAGSDGDVLQRILVSMVQLKAELDGDNRRAGSGIVIASDPKSSRCWIITTRHLLEPTKPHRIWATILADGVSLAAEVVKASDDLDLAILSIQGVAPPAVTLKDVTRLGQDVWVVGFPWGRRLTVVRGVVSQLAGSGDDMRLQGSPRMVDASVSYGSSGGGVFEVETGSLVGIVEGYRTARVALPNASESVLHIPVPGETTVVSAAGVRRFLSSAGLPR